MDGGEKAQDRFISPVQLSTHVILNTNSQCVVI